MLVLDHLVVAAETLEAGIAHVSERLGIEMTPGGKHPAMGTHNALVALGPGLYLEVIAVDPAAPSPESPRWFHLDRFSGPPRLVTWVCRTDDLEEMLRHAPPDAGRPLPLARGDLAWRMAVNPAGEMPCDGAYPMLIEWETARHPADDLPDLGLGLRKLEVQHPDAGALRVALDGLLSDPRVEIAMGPFALRAEIETPAGPRTLE